MYIPILIWVCRQRLCLADTRWWPLWVPDRTSHSRATRDTFDLATLPSRLPITLRSVTAGFVEVMSIVSIAVAICLHPTLRDVG